MKGSFTLLDWSVVALVFLLTTWIAHRKSGRQANLRDFYLGGKRLPWYAVSASIVATEISAVTFVSLPSVVWRPGGDLTYLQIALVGSFLARAFIAWKVVPAYYEEEILSPYDYMGRRRGEGVRRTATVLFTLGGLLGQSARVYQTALVLEILMQPELTWVQAQTGLPPLVTATFAMGIVACAWTWMGGMATVVWTDAVLFLCFALGIAVLLYELTAGVDGGVGAVFSAAAREGKLRLFDFRWDPTRAYTFWAAAIASSWSGVGQYGTDQLMAQRLLCCRAPSEARKAIVASIAVVPLIFAVQCVGLALWAFTREHPLRGSALELVHEKPDRILPVYIVEFLRPGWSGLVVAGALAAAVSSLDSILAALAQTSAGLLKPLRRAAGERPAAPADSRKEVQRSRLFVLFWACALCCAAIAVEPLHARYGSVLDLALSMATYTVGALLAGFVLARLELPVDGSGYLWSAPLSACCVFGAAWHGVLPQRLCLALALLLVPAWACLRTRRERRTAPRRALVQLLAFVVAALLPLACARWLVFGEGQSLAFPWFIPLGSTYALVFAVLLARPAPVPIQPT